MRVNALHRPGTRPVQEVPWSKNDPTLFEDLEEKVEAVRQAYPDLEIVPLIVAHFARPVFLAEAESRGVAVIQSFEW